MLSEAKATNASSRITFEPWSFCAQPPGAVIHPNQLNGIHPHWLPALVPGTVASALQAQGAWDISKPLEADTGDWWYRTAFAVPDREGQACYLCLDGLATLAEVWLNGQRLLTTDNMFRAHRLDIARHLKDTNDLAICFRSLTANLGQKRPRPRWKTNLVSHQQLRWQRTTLLGRIPGWSPPVTPVGPWRSVWLDTRSISVHDLRLMATLENTTGVVSLHACADACKPIERAHLQVGTHDVPVECHREADGWILRAKVRIPSAPLWWPHTHGQQPLLEASLTIDAADEQHRFPCGKIGFRQVHVVQDRGFGIQVNGVPVYCRGACWTVNDLATLDGSAESLTHDLQLAHAAGMNMLRIGGTMIYESDRFYDLCDELGILVWQDFMFANMDYPVEDQAFAAGITAEAQYQLGRLSRHPSIVMYCGNSEVEQQAAMLGVARDLWRNTWFAESLPQLCAAYHPGTGYVPSTPSGGVMPFHVGTGITHYYGVGAYLRSPQELRRADVKFTPECLGFANIPEPVTIDAITGGALPAMHHPLWKQRVPRDSGAGWDFEDVRDFYLQHHFGVDPVQLRCFDMPRYLQLGSVVTGEMMAQTFAEWRSGCSSNQGALVWFFKDFWPAAGWGIVDSSGLPKAPYYYLRRSWQPRQITMTDEGLDGLHVHVTNESPEVLQGHVEMILLKDQHIVVARQEVAVELASGARKTLGSDELLGGFHDVAYAYRFGPPQHDVVIATLYDAGHHVLSEAFHFLHKRDPQRLATVDLQTRVELTDAPGYRIVLHSNRFLQSVHLEMNGFLPDDNYFHLAPGRDKVVQFRGFKGQPARFSGYVSALNLETPVKLSWKQPTA